MLFFACFVLNYAGVRPDVCQNEQNRHETPKKNRLQFLPLKTESFQENLIQVNPSSNKKLASCRITVETLVGHRTGNYDKAAFIFHFNADRTARRRGTREETRAPFENEPQT